MSCGLCFPKFVDSSPSLHDIAPGMYLLQCDIFYPTSLWHSHRWRYPARDHPRLEYFPRRSQGKNHGVRRMHFIRRNKARNHRNLKTVGPVQSIHWALGSNRTFGSCVCFSGCLPHPSQPKTIYKSVRMADVFQTPRTLYSSHTSHIASSSLTLNWDHSMNFSLPDCTWRRTWHRLCHFVPHRS